MAQVLLPLPACRLAQPTERERRGLSRLFGSMLATKLPQLMCHSRAIRPGYALMMERRQHTELASTQTMLTNPAHSGRDTGTACKQSAGSRANSAVLSCMCMLT